MGKTFEEIRMAAPLLTALAVSLPGCRGSESGGGGGRGRPWVAEGNFCQGIECGLQTYKRGEVWTIMTEKGRTPKYEADLGAIKDFFQDIDRESDRGLAVLGAAYLHECLGWLIASFLVKNATKADGTAKWPLESPAARIRAAYYMGLISGDEHHDLEKINQIRNQFAHDPRVLSFSEADIARECNELRLWKPAPPWLERAPARNKFAITTSRLWNQLGIRILMQKPNRRKTPSEFKVVEIVGFMSEEDDSK